ncbi:MAG: HAD family hydrolase [Phycisphaerae bacterium]|nr:HAD family hydrolase [Phycisphaerae bacterium]
MSQKAIFLDRDDTVINDPGYINEPEQVTLLPGVAEALIQFKRMGYLIIIITNQSAIARGYITEKKLEQIHQKLKNLLSAAGATIDRLYYCPYHPEGTVEGFNKESHLRKPSPGMLQKAAEEMDIDLSLSWMIGDRYRDIEAGKAAGCHTIMVDVPGKTRELNTAAPDPDRKAVNLREAVNIIRMYEFHQKAQAAKKTALDSLQADTSRTPEASVKHEISPPPVENEGAKTIPDTNNSVQTELHHSSPSAAPQDDLTFSPVKLHTAKPVSKHDEPDPDEHAEKTHHLLQEILQRLKSSGRNELYDDFSIHKLLAGMAQVLAIGCIIFSLCLWLSPKASSDTVQIMVGYAVVLQLLVISLLMMHRQD